MTIPVNKDTRNVSELQSRKASLGTLERLFDVAKDTIMGLVRISGEQTALMQRNATFGVLISPDALNSPEITTVGEVYKSAYEVANLIGISKESNWGLVLYEKFEKAHLANSIVEIVFANGQPSVMLVHDIYPDLTPISDVHTLLDKNKTNTRYIEGVGLVSTRAIAFKDRKASRETKKFEVSIDVSPMIELPLADMAISRFVAALYADPVVGL